jgi:hypothetical protein
MWTTVALFLCVSTAILSLASAIRAVRAAQSVDRAWASVHRRVSSVESGLASTDISVTKWKEMTEELSNSVKMSKIRRGLSIPDKKIGFDAEPDSAQDPEAWRAWMNSRLRADKFRG